MPDDLLLVLTIRIKKNSCLENYICIRAFKHRPVPMDLVFCTRMLCVARANRANFLNYMFVNRHDAHSMNTHTRCRTQVDKNRQNRTRLVWTQNAVTVDYLSHGFFQTCTHLHKHKCEDVFLVPLFKEIVGLLAWNSPLMKSFALTISSDESQSKAQLNPRSLRDKTGYPAENKICFHRGKLQKRPHLFTLIFYTLW